MFLVKDTSDANANAVVEYDEEYRMNSGITPSTRNIRKRKFKRPYTDKQVPRNCFNWTHIDFYQKQEITAAEIEILRLTKGSQEDEEIEMVEASEILDQNR